LPSARQYDRAVHYEDYLDHEVGDRSPELKSARAPVVVTFFADYAAATKREEQLTLEVLAEKVRDTDAATRDKLPWLKFARFGDIRTDKNSLRNNANVIAITGVEGDYDQERISVDTALELLTEAGLSALLYTSPSHTEDAPRWRVICPCSREHPPDERERLLARVNGVLGGVLSRESWTLSQSYYFGSVGKNPSHQVEVLDGDCIDLRDDLDVEATGKPKPAGAERPVAEGPDAARTPVKRSDGGHDLIVKRLGARTDRLLDHVRGAPDQTKHHTLFRIGRTVGGYLAGYPDAFPWTAEQAAVELVSALPASVKDWNAARKTACDAIRVGMQAPLFLEDRILPCDGKGVARGRHGPERDPRDIASQGAAPRGGNGEAASDCNEIADGGDGPDGSVGNSGQAPPPAPRGVWRLAASDEVEALAPGCTFSLNHITGRTWVYEPAGVVPDADDLPPDDAISNAIAGDQALAGLWQQTEGSAERDQAICGLLFSADLDAELVRVALNKLPHRAIDDFADLIDARVRRMARIAHIKRMPEAEFAERREALAQELGLGLTALRDIRAEGKRETRQAAQAERQANAAARQDERKAERQAKEKKSEADKQRLADERKRRTQAAQQPQAHGALFPPGFKMDNQGLWFEPLPRGDEPAQPIQVTAAPFAVLAQTNDDADGNHGLRLSWSSATGAPHRWAMPQRLVHAQGNDIASELTDLGLPCLTSKAAHELLKAFFGGVTSQNRVRCLDRTGWHDGAFVTPGCDVFAPPGTEELVLQTEHIPVGEAFAARGTHKQWKDHVARYAVDNHQLTFVISAGFGAPLLKQINLPGMGVNLVGPSSIGKTSANGCGASIWGPASIQNGCVVSWHGTLNSLEHAAARRNDNLLPLDELGAANARDVGAAVYMLMSGRGKTRMRRDSTPMPPIEWCVLVLSSSEVTLNDKMGEAGQTARAGQEIRLLDIPADMGAGHGVFQRLHGQPDGAALADLLRRNTLTYCGTAGPGFIERLVDELAHDRDRFIKALWLDIDKFLASDAVPIGADGQVRSAATRFALIAAAGERAQRWGIVPWKTGAATAAARNRLAAWLDARGTAGAAEDQTGIRRVATYLALHGTSRFERLGTGNAPLPGEQRILNRAGYSRPSADGDGRVYLVLGDVWRDEICKGLDPVRVARALRRAGYLKAGDAKNLTTQVRIRGEGKPRLYVISGAILGRD
jgi:uncharacterized protein (DUF927 family)